jgi:ASPIC and UnbV
VIPFRKIERSGSVLFLAAVSVLANSLAPQTTQPTKTATARAKLGEVLFEVIAPQAGLSVKSNRAALGAVVTLEQGSDKHEKEVRSGDGYISQSDLRLHFGLGKSPRAEKIVIRWPSGLVETLSDLRANQSYVVREGSGVDQSKTRGVSAVRIARSGYERQIAPC